MRQYSINFRGRNGLDRGVDRLVSMSEYVTYLRYQLATQLFYMAIPAMQWQPNPRLA